MAITNFIGAAKLKTYEELYCSTEITGSIHSQLICPSVLNIFLSISAYLGKILILVALHKESSLHLPSKLLFRSLAITDLCVGITEQPLIVTKWMSIANERWDICRFMSIATFITGYMLCSLSLLTSINPILYCWKIRKVRQAAKDTIRQHFCFSS